MDKKELKLTVIVYAHREELPVEHNRLLQEAGLALEHAYAPYSGFSVGVALALANGQVVTGSNQENAAFPAGLCAEGTAFSAASAVYPGTAVLKMAVTVRSSRRPVAHPVAPCGICRQRILEYENRFQQPVQIIMAAETGPVYVVNSVQELLPLHFSQLDL